MEVAFDVEFLPGSIKSPASLPYSIARKAWLLMNNSNEPTFWKRLAIAAVNMLVPLMASLLVLYFSLRGLGRSDHWLLFGAGYVLPWLLAPGCLLFPLSWAHPKRVMRGLAFLPVAALIILYAPQFLPSLQSQSAESTFRVMVHNVWRGNQDLDALIAQIQEQDPDIIGLHEFTDPLRAALLRELSQTYPYQQTVPHVGLLSRYPIESCQAFRMGANRGDPGPWAQACVIDIQGRTITVFNVHPRSPSLIGEDVPWLPFRVLTGLAEEGTVHDNQDLKQRIAETEGPVLVIGDLNITDQQKYYKPLIQGLHDAFRQAGWGMGFTFSRWPHLNFCTWRIDYIFYSSELLALSAATGDFAGSDHRPVIADLGFRPTTSK